MDDTDETLPASIDPDDLPDDPAVLKELVVELYETVVASTELVTAAEEQMTDGLGDLGWLTQHLEGADGERLGGEAERYQHEQ